MGTILSLWRADQHAAPCLLWHRLQVGKSLRRGRRRKYEAHAGIGKATVLIKPLGKNPDHEPWVAAPGTAACQVSGPAMLCTATWTALKVPHGPVSVLTSPPFAHPDGSTRKVTEDEALLLRKRTPKPRRKTLW